MTVRPINGTLRHVPLKEPEWGPAEQFSNRSSIPSVLSHDSP